MAIFLTYKGVLEYLGISKSSAKYYHLLDTLPEPRYIGLSKDGEQMKRWLTFDIDEWAKGRPKITMMEDLKSLFMEK